MAGLPSAIAGLFELVSTGALSALFAVFICVLAVAVTYLVVFVERGQRKITVNYAKRQVGNRVYQGQTSHLPLKLNMAGVMPAIFASALLAAPLTLAEFYPNAPSDRFGDSVMTLLKLRGRVELVPPGSLPNDGLVIEDQRTYD